jgi:1,4-dihydroxy-2-naphthoate polyprenyltransferase
VTRSQPRSRLVVWWHGARPRTLAASLAPVVVGTAAAGRAESWRFVAALLVGLGLQIGVNYANDYHDGVRGVDTHERLGPPRLVSSGMASPRSVLVAALVCIGVAGVSGLGLAIATTPWLVPLGAVAMLALWLYTGGPRPYAGLGLGELMVFLFFGVMATAGTAYVQAEHVAAAAWWASAAMGFLAVAILVANNLRDIPTDAATGRRTLAVRLGDRRTRALYRLCIAAAFVTVVLAVLVNIAQEGAGMSQWALFALAAWPIGLAPFDRVGEAEGRALIPVLVGTAWLQLTFGALLALGLWIAGATAS